MPELGLAGVKAHPTWNEACYPEAWLISKDDFLEAWAVRPFGFILSDKVVEVQRNV